MKRLATIHPHTNASHKFTNTKTLLETPNRARTEKMTYYLLDYDPSLHHYLHRLDPTQDPICPSCRLDEQDLNYWLCESRTGDAIRQQVFGNHKGSLEWLPLDLGMWWRTQGRPWSTLTPNQARSFNFIVSELIGSICDTV